MITSDFRVVMLVDSGELSKIVYNGIKQEFNVVRVLVEEDISSLDLVRKRVKRLGLLKTLGQVLFVFFNRFVISLSAHRIDAIKKESNYSAQKNTKKDLTGFLRIFPDFSVTHRLPSNPCLRSIIIR